MLDPRIAQRQIELEQRKKQQQKNLQLGQNSTKTAPTPAISPVPAAPKSAPQPSYTNTNTGYGNAVRTAYIQSTATKTKAVGPNAEAGIITVPKKEDSIFEKVENQSVNYAKSGWKLFDWLDDFSQNKGPNNEMANIFN